MARAPKGTEGRRAVPVKWLAGYINCVTTKEEPKHHPLLRPTPTCEWWMGWESTASGERRHMENYFTATHRHVTV